MPLRALGFVALLITLVSVIVISACSTSDGGGASCPSDLPAACPATPPSFKDQVEPIIVNRCWACHTDGGPAAATHDFSTYDNISRQKSEMLNQVYGCKMPPNDAGQPTADERAALLNWFVCKAPNN